MNNTTLVARLVLVPVLALAFASGAARADSFAEKCPDISSCAKVVSQLLDQKYVYDAGDVKGKWEATPNLDLTKDNAETLFTDMLYANGFTRMPLSVPNTFQILRVRDAKDSAIPTFYANAQQQPNLPNTWDFATLVYTTVDAENAESISRVLRNFMPANARIVALDTGKLLVTDAVAHLSKLYAMLRDLDVKPTPELRRRRAEAEKRHEQMMILEHSNGPRPEGHHAEAPKPPAQTPSGH